MASRKLRIAVFSCGLAALLAMPAESSACCCFDWLFGCGRTTYSPRAYSYAPTYAPAAMSYAPASCAPSCAPACPPQTCYYVPQTCYRTVYQPVAATTCQAVTGCDPCTGCPVTTYRPVSTWTYRPVLVPYTTYRMVYSYAAYANPCSPCASYSSCAPGGSSCGSAGSPCGGATVSSGITFGTTTSVAPGCASGNCGAVRTEVAPPSIPAPAPGPGPASSAPSLEGNVVPRTFQEQPSQPGSQPQPQGTLKPIPNTNLNSTPAPKLFDPDGRTTSSAVRETSYFRLIPPPPAAVPVRAIGLGDDGWRPSRD